MNATQPGTLFGHPTGLYTLFFAEMWERFSFYGMRALLLFYMIKGFLGYGDRDAYAIYGAYTALVYMTPLFGGMLADRLLGARRAVVLGGLLMAAGHLMMSAENDVAFFLALALLIVGNGFFKPNISTMVGSLYPQGSPKRDTGFTIFYMGSTWERRCRRCCAVTSARPTAGTTVSGWPPWECSRAWRSSWPRCVSPRF